MNDDDQQARQALASVPGFAPQAVAAARFTRLRGLTNRVYKVETQGMRYCLRIPGAGTAAIIDRRVEEKNARAAHAAGRHAGRALFRRRRRDADAFRRRCGRAFAGALARKRRRDRARGAGAQAAAPVRAATFARRFDVFAIIRAYADLLERGGMEVPEGVRSLIDGSGALAPGARSASGHAQAVPLRSDRARTCSTTASASGWSTGNIPG